MQNINHILLSRCINFVWKMIYYITFLACTVALVYLLLDVFDWSDLLPAQISHFTLSHLQTIINSAKSERVKSDLNRLHNTATRQLAHTFAIMLSRSALRSSKNAYSSLKCAQHRSYACEHLPLSISLTF